MKEIKVRLHHISTGSCLEIWQAQPENGRTRYYGRDTHGQHIWSVVDDAPHGYCEKSHYVGVDIVFIVCDKNWNELFRDSNAEGYKPFPTLEMLCQSEWEKTREQYPAVTRSGFADWILSKATEHLDETDKLNWRDMWNTTAHVEHLSEFDFLGEKYSIQRISKKHTKCDFMWYEYFAGRKGRGKYENYVGWFGYEFSDELSRQIQLNTSLLQ